MKSLLVFVAVVAGLVVIGGAGYFGLQAAQPARAAVVEVPPTIPVERGDVQLTVTAPGQLVNTRDDILAFDVAGRMSEISVEPGRRVKAGDVLAELDDTALGYAVATARANLASAQARLEQFKTPPTESEIAAARAAVSSAQAAHAAAAAKYGQRDNQLTVAATNLEKMRVELELAQAAYDRVAYAEDIGMRPESRALQQATINYQSALANYSVTTAEINDTAVQAAAQALAQARATLDTLTAPVSPQEIAIQQAAVESAQVALAQAEDALAHVTLAAPYDGIVQTVHVQQGEAVGAGEPVVQVLDPSALQVRSTVTEEDYTLVQEGMPTELFFDAQPELVLRGTVTRIVPLRDTGSTSALYPIYILPAEVPEHLAPGMTVDASVEIAKQEDVLRLPRALVRAQGDGAAQVNVWNGRGVETRMVKTGLRGDQYVEILEGLAQGDLVVSR